MSFSDPDQVEEEMSQRVEDMSADDLVHYFLRSSKLVNDIDITVTARRDYSIFLRLVEDYKQPHAGRLIKWMFYKHKGKAMIDGRKAVVRVSQLSRPWRWLTDQWNVQAQMDLKREERRLKAPKVTKFVTADDL